jgi:hypothetical protein
VRASSSQGSNSINATRRRRSHAGNRSFDWTKWTCHGEWRPSRRQIRNSPDRRRGEKVALKWASR